MNLPQPGFVVPAPVVSVVTSSRDFPAPAWRTRNSFAHSSSPAPSTPCFSSKAPVVSSTASLQTRVGAVVAAALLAFAPAVATVSPALAAKGGGDTFLSASGDVNKDGESLLRWALPLENRPVRDLQASLESAINNTRGLKWAKVDGDVRKAAGLIKNQGAAILAGVNTDKKAEGSMLISKITDAMPALTAAVAEQKVDKLVEVDRDVLRDVGRLEEMMVKGFPFEIPAEYSSLPRLLGRATVEVVVRKDGGEQFDIDGTLYKQGVMTLVLDGYSAPLSAGAFVDLASKGFYDGLPVIRSDGFIIQSGKPRDGEGVVNEDGSTRIVPLEVFARGDRMPLYGSTLEDDGRGSQATLLPFSSFGTLAMAREEFVADTASSQYFWFLFEPDLTPAGRNLMDGSWGVFGYTVKGEKFLKGLQKGDEIVSVKVVDGLENLKSAST
jgi:peptidylprolyl isomerase